LLPGIAGKGADKLWRSFQIEFQTPKSKTPLAVALQDSIAAFQKGRPRLGAVHGDDRATGR